MVVKMTYKELLNELQKLTEEQLSCTITVEDAHEEECHPAELRVCGENHDSLDDGHPVIFVP
jgi:hypothetical protein